jgi:hypothetical protein
VEKPRTKNDTLKTIHYVEITRLCGQQSYASSVIEEVEAKSQEGRYMTFFCHLLCKDRKKRENKQNGNLKKNTKFKLVFYRMILHPAHWKKLPIAKIKYQSLLTGIPLPNGAIDFLICAVSL